MSESSGKEMHLMLRVKSQILHRLFMAVSPRAIGYCGSTSTRRMWLRPASCHSIAGNA